jgi:hypothetical protein
MTFKLGNTYGRRQQERRCNELALEDAPVARASKQSLDGVETVLIRSGCYWQPMFLCPLCGSTRRALYEVEGQWQCRVCGRLDYKSKHEWRGGSFTRAWLLRMKLGAAYGDPVLPPRPTTPRAAKKYDRIVKRILRIEDRGHHETMRMLRSARAALGMTDDERPDGA